MNNAQFELLHTTIKPEPQLATARGLYTQTPRTLVFGYTCERNTFHVYLADGAIHKVVYNHNRQLLEQKHQDDGLLFSECVPDKRMYPEACDFEFCAELKRRGVHLSFTSWNDKREQSAYYGMRVEDLAVVTPGSTLDVPRDAEGWNLNPRHPDSDAAAGALGAKLYQLLVAAQAAGARTLDEARSIRNVMYMEMDKYQHLGARDASAEWMLVAHIECAFGLPAQSLTR